MTATIENMSLVAAGTAALNFELANGGKARDAFDAMVASGKYTRQSAFDLFHQAYCLCLLEVEHGLESRWPEVAVAISNGRTIDELWPKGFYKKPEGQQS